MRHSCVVVGKCVLPKPLSMSATGYQVISLMTQGFRALLSRLLSTEHSVSQESCEECALEQNRFIEEGPEPYLNAFL